MPVRPAPRVPPTAIAIAALGLLLLAWAGGLVARAAVAARVRAAARERGLEARWDRLGVGFPMRVRCFDLAIENPRTGAAVLRAETLFVDIGAASLLSLRPAPSGIVLAHARVALPGGGGAPDTLAPETEEPSPGGAPVAPRVRRAAEALARALLLPARSLPRLELRDIVVGAAGRGPEPAAGRGPGVAPSPGAGGSAGDPAGGEEDAGRGAVIRWLELRPARGGVRLAGSGMLELETPVPFDLDVTWRRDDHLEGGARFLVPGPGAPRGEPLRIAVSGALAQDRRAGELRLADTTRLSVGDLRFAAGGRVARRGPAFSVRLAADGLTPDALRSSLPAAVLGPLREVRARGAWDWRFALDLDLASPDSARVRARVVPHGLQLDLDRTRLELPPPDGPFVATVRLPRGRRVSRELSPANPHFLELGAMDSILVHAVVTNEDGGFFRHGGFNLEAVEGAIADNLRAGRFKRGAGTITMQLARNLYLGHERTLSRKMQEVVLAWTLEHLTWLSKRRLLEIYLNIIEWGPGVHGADEAARYYFGHGARRLTVDESLFLTTVIPAPTRWRWRLDDAGALRPWARAQMHFIGRAMVAKGWLAADELPPADSLRVELRGPAREALFPPAVVDTTGADEEGAAAPPRATPADSSVLSADVPVPNAVGLRRA